MTRIRDKNCTLDESLRRPRILDSETDKQKYKCEKSTILMFLFIRQQGAKTPCARVLADQAGEGGGPWIMFYWLWFPGSPGTSLLSNSTQPSVGRVLRDFKPQSLPPTF